MKIEFRLTEGENCVVVITDKFGGNHIYMSDEAWRELTDGHSVDETSSDAYQLVANALAIT